MSTAVSPSGGASPKELKDVNLWREARDQEVTLKRNASFTSIDESPISIDAVFTEPMVQTTTDSGKSGWLVSVGEDDANVEIMPELDMAPVAPVSPIAVPSTEDLQAQRICELQAKMLHAGIADGAEDASKLSRELDAKVLLLEEERAWHLRRAQELDSLIGETRAAADAAHAQHLQAAMGAVAMLVAKPPAVPEDEEELSVF